MVALLEADATSATTAVLTLTACLGRPHAAALAPIARTFSSTSSEGPIWTARVFQNSGLPSYLIVVGMLVLYLFLGCVMDSLAMILITIPIFWPIVAALDFGLQADDVKLWFGILTLMVVEIGLITPPVGLNVFVINSLARDDRDVSRRRPVLDL